MKILSPLLLLCLSPAAFAGDSREYLNPGLPEALINIQLSAKCGAQAEPRQLYIRSLRVRDGGILAAKTVDLRTGQPALLEMQVGAKALNLAEALEQFGEVEITLEARDCARALNQTSFSSVEVLAAEVN
jgi:hypothetical protein